MLKKFSAFAASIGLAALSVVTVLAVPSGAKTDAKVTICHRTNSVTNPYEKITVDESSVNDPTKTSDHLHHLGGVFDFSADPDVAYPTPRNGDQWGDIVPPFDENGDPRPDTSLTLNWPAGKAIFDAGCANPDQIPVPGGGALGYLGLAGAVAVGAGLMVWNHKRRGAAPNAA